MGKKDGIQARDFPEGLRAFGVRVDPGVNESELAAGGGQSKSAVTEIGNLVAFQIEHLCLRQIILLRCKDDDESRSHFITGSQEGTAFYPKRSEGHSLRKQHFLFRAG